jgi:hypothetical protein
MMFFGFSCCMTVQEEHNRMMRSLTHSFVLDEILGDGLCFDIHWENSGERVQSWNSVMGPLPIWIYVQNTSLRYWSIVDLDTPRWNTVFTTHGDGGVQYFGHLNWGNLPVLWPVVQRESPCFRRVSCPLVPSWRVPIVPSIYLVMVGYLEVHNHSWITQLRSFFIIWQSTSSVFILQESYVSSRIL